jgi:hypothetical protein|tara:strand:+ start:25274 stop:25597 length:324 start_codon:yes stop_codon:yes gene_type:complete
MTEILKKVRSTRSGLVGITEADEKVALRSPVLKTVAGHYQSTPDQHRDIKKWRDATVTHCFTGEQDDTYVQIGTARDLRDPGTAQEYVGIFLPYNFYRKSSRPQLKQ